MTGIAHRFIDVDGYRGSRASRPAALCPAFQAFLRMHQPKLLTVRSKNDPFFLPPGAEAFTPITGS